jgi:hypothetical protein
MNNHQKITSVPLLAIEPPRFDIRTESNKMLEYLFDNGYAIVNSKDLFLDWAQKISSNLSRYDPNSRIDKNWIADPKNGII